MPNADSFNDLTVAAEAEGIKFRKSFTKSRLSGLENESKLLNMAQPIIDVPLHLLDLIEHDEDNPPYQYESPLLGDNASKKVLGGSKFLPDDAFMPDDSFVIASKDH